jgi:hypothetical protein
MKWLKTAVSAAMFGAVAGCAAPGGGLMNANMASDIGQAPADYESAVHRHLQYALKDPESLRDFAVGRPERASCAIGIYGNFHGWRVPVQYNAKNSFGGYVGVQRAYFWFHGEQLKGVGGNPGFCPEAPAWR